MDEITEQAIKNRIGENWRFASQAPLVGSDSLWLPQETSHTAGAGPFILFTRKTDRPFFVEGVWVTSSQFRDLFSIRPELRVDNAQISQPQDVSTFAPMGEGLVRLHPVQITLDKNQTFQIVSQAMTFYTGQVTKTYLAVMRGWYL